MLITACAACGVQVFSLNLEQIACTLAISLMRSSGLVLIRQIQIGIGQQIDGRPRRNRANAQEAVFGQSDCNSCRKYDAGIWM